MFIKYPTFSSSFNSKGLCFFFGLNYAKFLNDLILYADMIKYQNTKPDKSWCFLKKIGITYASTSKKNES